jgi:hypothetical protein
MQITIRSDRRSPDSAKPDACDRSLDSQQIDYRQPDNLRAQSKATAAGSDKHRQIRQVVHPFRAGG